MLRKNDSPSKLFKYHQIWMTKLKECQLQNGDTTYELLKGAWCMLNKIDEKKMTKKLSSALDKDLSAVLDMLTFRYSQDLRKTSQILKSLCTRLGSYTSLWQEFTKPQLYELAEPEDDLDYCKFVFHLPTSKCK